MTREEARKIFKGWQDYMEIADKMNRIFPVVPEAFLPYPVEVLEEALNITAKDYFDAGNKKMADTIQSTMGSYLTGYFLTPSRNKMTDQEVLKHMKKTLDFILEHPELEKTTIELMKKAQDNWIELNK